jgi:hypothetical protein
MIRGGVNFLKEKYVFAQPRHTSTWFMGSLSLMREDGGVKMMIYLPFCSIKQHVMMVYGGVGIKRHAFLSLLLD